MVPGAEHDCGEEARLLRLRHGCAKGRHELGEAIQETLEGPGRGAIQHIGGEQGKELATEVLERVGITVDKNLIPFDPRPATETSGIRVGSPALTSRRMREAEMGIVCDLIHRAQAAPEDAATQAKVAREVAELCEDFPLYLRSYHR